MIPPSSAARAKVLDRFSAEDQPHTLDGMAYMNNAVYFDNNQDVLIPDDKLAIEWMLRNVQGSPVILEGNTPNYRWGNRFAIYTGLPAVMGWDWHERQQRSDRDHEPANASWNALQRREQQVAHRAETTWTAIR